MKRARKALDKARDRRDSPYVNAMDIYEVIEVLVGNGADRLASEFVSAVVSAVSKRSARPLQHFFIDDRVLASWRPIGTRASKVTPHQAAKAIMRLKRDLAPYSLRIRTGSQRRS
jgi:predicted nucleic acid-binding protein